MRRQIYYFRLLKIFCVYVNLKAAKLHATDILPIVWKLFIKVSEIESELTRNKAFHSQERLKEFSTIADRLRKRLRLRYWRLDHKYRFVLNELEWNVK